MLWIIALTVLFVAVYVVWLRNWLKEQPWAQGFFAVIEPVERWLWDKSETILWSRFLIIIGLLPPILDQFQSLQGSGILDVVPEKYRPWLSLSFTLCGIVSELLRRSTTRPLDVVSLPDKGVPPAVAEAVAIAEVTKQDAVAKVAEMKKAA